MNDDREVTCYALLIEHPPARTCAMPRAPPGSRSATPTTAATLLAATLVDAKVFSAADVWRKARLAIEAGRLRAARQAAALVSLERREPACRS